MSTKPHVIDFAGFSGFLGWSLAILVAVLALALGSVLPANLIFVLALTVLLATGIGVAGLRRHGGPGVPSLPYGASD
ncbi:MAG: hypothetical protein QJR07_16625 [Acetobacteraceae bacterium]|nr:hypothetical protein [Acetobacteraceae bacterium]MDI3308717.1 hypothetical protein [Acetobacteraceae bacterium]